MLLQYFTTCVCLIGWIKYLAGKVAYRFLNIHAQCLWLQIAEAHGWCVARDQ